MAMDTVRHILQIKGDYIWTILPEDTVFEALRRMAVKDVGALLVFNQENRMVGIISERDYARKIILQGKTSRDTLVREIMTPDVIVIHPDQTVDEAMELMTKHKIRHLPVCENERIIGVISIGDAIRSVLHRQRETIRSYETGTRPFSQ